MGRIDELLARQKEIEKELEEAKEEERRSVLEDIKDKIKLFGFESSDFRDVLEKRKNRKEED